MVMTARGTWNDPGVRLRHLARFATNAVNLSTPLGLLTAVVGRATLTWGPRGLVLATGYRLPIPPANAFTVGNVIVSRRPRDQLVTSVRVFRHEERHSWQYVACLGLPLIPLYLLACGWSLLRCGHYGRRNPFEQWAGLEDGGYLNRPRR